MGHVADGHDHRVADGHDHRVADGHDQNCEQDDAHDHHHAVHEPDDHGQNCEPDDDRDRHYRDADDLGDRQHLLVVADDCPLQKALPAGQFSRLDLCEVYAQNQSFRRVAWHRDAIAYSTNKD